MTSKHSKCPVFKDTRIDDELSVFTKRFKNNLKFGQKNNSPKLKNSNQQSKGSSSCFMARSESSSDDDEYAHESPEVRITEQKKLAARLPKDKLVYYYCELVDICHNRGEELDECKEELDECKRQIYDIAEEYVLLKRKLKKSKAVIPPPDPGMKGVKSANIPGADSGMMEKQIAELQIQNRVHLDKIDSISAEMEGLRKKYDSELEMSIKRIKELEKDRDDTASSLKESIKKCESLTSEIEVLKCKLREALDVSKKWEGSANALKILNKQRHNMNKEGLGFQGKNPSKQN